MFALMRKLFSHVLLIIIFLIFHFLLIAFVQIFLQKSKSLVAAKWLLLGVLSVNRGIALGLAHSVVFTGKHVLLMGALGIGLFSLLKEHRMLF